MNRWTVHVTDFGKIKKADVQVAPLTLFLGDNNSGKSYVMTLIYGLLNARFYFDEYEFGEETEAYKECCRILDKMLNPVDIMENTEYALDAQEQQSFQLLLNEVLKRNKVKFLKNLFNREMKIGELSVSFPELEKCGFVLKHTNDVAKNQEFISIYGTDEDGFLLSGYRMPKDFQAGNMGRYRFFLAYIMETLIRMDFRGDGEARTVYFPTARTGFLLTYKTLVGSAMSDKFNFQETDKNLLTRPNSDFLISLSSMNTQMPTEDFRGIVEFIEKDLIHGHISVSDLPAHDIMYTPDGEEHALPMFVTSGVVTELTPLLLFMQYVDLGTVLMEEPEISLHLELQWSMARILIRLMNMGIPVFVTTHSDIILQHVNNMIKLSNVSDVKKFLKDLDYDASDLVTRRDVAVYQFDIGKNQKTQVTKLSCGDYGFEAMTFYNTLEKMNNQINQIDDMEE